MANAHLFILTRVLRFGGSRSQGSGEGKKACRHSHLAHGAGGAPEHDAAVLEEARAAIVCARDGEALARLHAHDEQVHDQQKAAEPHECHADPNLQHTRPGMLEHSLCLAERL